MNVSPFNKRRTVPLVAHLPGAGARPHDDPRDPAQGRGGERTRTGLPAQLLRRSPRLSELQSKSRHRPRYSSFFLPVTMHICVTASVLSQFPMDGCRGQEGEEGRGQEPVDQEPDEAREEEGPREGAVSQFLAPGVSLAGAQGLVDRPLFTYRRERRWAESQ